METITLGKSQLESSRLVYGCMRTAGDGSRDDEEKGRRAIRAALEAGYTHIVGGGHDGSLTGFSSLENSIRCNLTDGLF